MNNRAVQFSRRALLVGGAGAFLAGCTSRSDQSGSTTPAASPTSSSSTPPPLSVPPVPTAEEVAARFAGQTPTKWGTDVPGVVNTIENPTSNYDVALTFDACGGKGGAGVDEDLLATLEKHQIPATLFLNQRWIDANRKRAEELAHNPLYEIGNHGTTHLPLSVNGRAAYKIDGTPDTRAAAEEVRGNHIVLTELLGHPPRWFRSGTAHYDEIAAQIVAAYGEKIGGFSVNGDAGATFPANTVAKEIGRAQHGDIVICHFNQPGSGTAPGLAQAIPELKNRGARFVHL